MRRATVTGHDVSCPVPSTPPPHTAATFEEASFPGLRMRTLSRLGPQGQVGGGSARRSPCGSHQGRGGGQWDPEGTHRVQVEGAGAHEGDGAVQVVAVHAVPVVLEGHHAEGKGPHAARAAVGQPHLQAHGVAHPAGRRLAVTGLSVDQHVCKGHMTRDGQGLAPVSPSFIPSPRQLAGCWDTDGWPSPCSPGGDRLGDQSVRGSAPAGLRLLFSAMQASADLVPRAATVAAPPCRRTSRGAKEWKGGGAGRGSLHSTAALGVRGGLGIVSRGPPPPLQSTFQRPREWPAPLGPLPQSASPLSTQRPRPGTEGSPLAPPEPKLSRGHPPAPPHDSTFPTFGEYEKRGTDK